MAIDNIYPWRQDESRFAPPKPMQTGKEDLPGGGGSEGDGTGTSGNTDGGLPPEAPNPAATPRGYMTDEAGNITGYTKVLGEGPLTAEKAGGPLGTATSDAPYTYGGSGLQGSAYDALAMVGKTGGMAPLAAGTSPTSGLGSDRAREAGGQVHLPGVGKFLPPGFGAGYGGDVRYDDSGTPDNGGHNPDSGGGSWDGTPDNGGRPPDGGGGTWDGTPGSPGAPGGPVASLPASATSAMTDSDKTRSYDIASKTPAKEILPASPSSEGTPSSSPVSPEYQASVIKTAKPAAPAAPTPANWQSLFQTGFQPQMGAATPAYGAPTAPTRMPPQEISGPRNQQDLFDKWRQTWGNQGQPLGVSAWDYAPTYFMPQTGFAPTPFQQQPWAMTNAMGPR